MKAVIDSCVIFGMPLCDTLLRSAEANLYQIVLSQKIIEDATRNMVLKGRLKPEKEIYYQQQIQAAPNRSRSSGLPTPLFKGALNPDNENLAAAILAAIDLQRVRVDRFTET